MSDSNHLSKSFPEIFRVVCVIAELSGDATKNATNMDDNQNNGDKLSSFKHSKDCLLGLLVSNLSPIRSLMILALRSKFLCLSEE